MKPISHKSNTTSAKTTKPQNNSSQDRRALALVIYGPSGVGKTSLAAHFPNVGFLYDPQEEGILDLVEYGQVPAPAFAHEAHSWQDLLAKLEKVESGRYKCDTLAIDSLSGLQRLCFTYHCDTYFNGDWSKDGFYSYYAGPKNAAKRDWPEFISKLRLVRQQGINVILLGHSRIKPYNDPSGPDYDRFIPDLDADIWGVTHQWAQGVFFYNYHVEMQKKKGVRSKAAPNSERRIIYTQWQPAFDAKERYGMESFVEAGTSPKESYENLMEAFSKV